MPSIADKQGLGPMRTVHELEDGTYRIAVWPPTSLSVKSVFLTADEFEGYLRWRNGESIQHALPTLTDGEREILMSGDPDLV